MRVLFIIILASVGFLDWTIIRVNRVRGHDGENEAPKRKPNGK